MQPIEAEEIESCINESFMPAFVCRDRYLVLYGGAGSGKSVAIAQKIVLRILKAMDSGKKHTFLCLRKTQPAARKSIFPLFQDIIEEWGVGKLYTINKSDMTIRFYGGCNIIITGLDDPEKIKSIHGITSVWLEEATEFTYDDFQQIDLRLRGYTWDYKQIAMSFNPIDEGHWIRKKLFTDEIQAEIEGGSGRAMREYRHEVEGKMVKYSAMFMHSTFQDNKFLDEVYRAKLLNLINEDTNYYNVYCKGLWGVLKGLIFEHWDVCDRIPEEADARGFGLDFGFSANPTSIVEVAFVGTRLYIKEHLYRPGLTNPDIAAELHGIKEGKAHCITVADCAEPKSLAEIRQSGQICVPSTKGKDSVAYGIQRMKQFEIHITKDSTNLLKEFQGYKWAEDKNGNPLNKPVKYNDHAIDAARYIITKLKGDAKVDLVTTKSGASKEGAQLSRGPAELEQDEAIWNG